MACFIEVQYSILHDCQLSYRHTVAYCFQLSPMYGGDLEIGSNYAFKLQHYPQHC